MDLEERAEAAYLTGAENPDRSWGELPEWIRESWRCEVDEERDPGRILAAAFTWAEQQGKDPE